MLITSMLNLNNNITYGYMDIKNKNQKSYTPSLNKKDKILAGLGSVSGVILTLSILKKRQEIKKYSEIKINKVSSMLPMAAAANLGGILLSSIKEHKEDIKNKWKEGTFQMLLTSTPMLLVDGTIKFFSGMKSKYINNNFVKLLASGIGVYTGSHFALGISNKLRQTKGSNNQERKLKLIDMIANLDDAVAMLVLARIPFADKIKMDKLFPFIYSFCGYRSGTGDKR